MGLLRPRRGDRNHRACKVLFVFGRRRLSPSRGTWQHRRRQNKHHRRHDNNRARAVLTSEGAAVLKQTLIITTVAEIFATWI